jgi:flagellar assembly protein FliH
MATVLKSHSPQAPLATTSPSGLAGFNLADLSQQARRQLEACQQEIVRMQAEAAAEIEVLRRQAHAEGLAAGRQEAAREAQNIIKAAVDARVGEHGLAVKSMVQQLAKLHEQWMQQYADSLVSLVVAVAQRVIRKQLQREPEVVLRWTHEALAAARSANRLTIAVHPETLAQLGGALDELLNQPGLPEESSILPDESVPIDGVIVRQLGGEVVITLDSQLERLQELLENA